MSEHMLAAAEDNRIGQVVQDRYRIVRKIGEGGMGAVYEGEHTLIQRRVAIKCLHAQFATNQEMVERFHREAMAANAIRHPNIVEVTDMGRFDDGAVFMVLEFLEGRELTEVFDEVGAMPLGRVVHIASQVCSALGAAHQQGIVHRDLKPDNIYLCPREEDPDFVKVLDFGIAKFKEAGGRGVTRTGMTMGTPHYMAPEQAQASKDLDHRADIYSLGVILFHAISGLLPFDDESFPMLMVKVVTHPPPRLSTIVPSIPPALDELVDRMLQKDPGQRPSSCAEVRGALVAFREDSTAYQASGPVRTEAAPGSLAIAPTAMIGAAGTGPQAAVAASGPRPVVPMETGAAPGPAASSGFAWKLGAAAGTLALLAVVAGGAVLWLTGSEDGADDAPPPVAGASAPVEGGEDAAGDTAADDERGGSPDAVEPSDGSPADAPSVRVQMQVEPAGAELFLDGHRIANPFDADLPQSSEPRRLEARLDGYRTVVQDLVLQYPQRVNIALERGRGVDDRRRARVGGPSGGRGRDARDERGGDRPTTRGGGEGGEAEAAPAPPPAAQPREAPRETPAGARDDGFLDIGGQF